MSNAFVPLDIFLSPPRGESPQPDRQQPPDVPPPPQCERKAAADARRFCAALADALELSLQRLLPQIAREVLGRELALKPADVCAIVAASLERFAGEKTLTLRVHPADAQRASALGVAIVADAKLRAGDALLDLHAGTIDMRLETRFDGVLEAFAA